VKVFSTHNAKVRREDGTVNMLHTDGSFPQEWPAPPVYCGMENPDCEKPKYHAPGKSCPIPRCEWQQILSEDGCRCVDCMDYTKKQVVPIVEGSDTKMEVCRADKCSELSKLKKDGTCEEC